MAPAPIPAGLRLDTRALHWNGARVFLIGHLTASGPAPMRADYYASYDPESDSWTRLPAPPWAGARMPMSIVAGDKLFLFGGDRFLNDGAMYDPKTDTWSTVPPSPLEGRTASLAYASTTGEVIVWGGATTAGTVDDNRHFNDGAAFSVATRTWRRIPDAPLTPRFSRVTFVGGKLVVLGGAQSFCDGCAHYGDGAMFDPVANVWRSLAVPDWYGARSNEVVENDGVARALFFGGFDRTGDRPTTRFDGAIVDALTGALTQIPAPTDATLAHASRRSAYSSWFGAGKLFVFGGWAEDDRVDPRIVHWGAHAYYSDGASFDPSTNTWTTLPPGGPSARAFGDAVWADCEAIVFGGRVGNERFSDGKIYRP